MTSAPPAALPSNIHSEEKPSVAIPLIVWLLIQLAAIALAASGVRLSASFPRPPQALAVHEMLAAQFVGSALFLPVLFRGWRAWLGMVMAVGPMLLLAARLAGTPVSRVVVAWVEVAAWLTTLALCRAALAGGPSGMSPASRREAPRSGAILPALALLLSAGGLLFGYLQAEFQPDGDFAILRLFPLPASLRRLSDPATKPSPLLSTVALSAAALVILAVKSVARSRNERSRPVETTHSATST